MIILLSLVIAALVVAWIKSEVGLLVLFRYMDMAGYRAPSDAEIEKCTEWVVRHALHWPQN